LTLKPADNFYAALQAAGLPPVPREFAVVPQHQIIPSNTMAEIREFVRVFDEVTARAAWQAAALREAPAIAQLRRNEVCFFSAWDFHLAPTGEWQLIEFNDNGSGFIFAAPSSASLVISLFMAPPLFGVAPIGEKDGVKFVEAMGVKSIAELRAKSAQEVLEGAIRSPITYAFGVVDGHVEIGLELLSALACRWRSRPEHQKRGLTSTFPLTSFVGMEP
jgi:hypothetical protein